MLSSNVYLNYWGCHFGKGEKLTPMGESMSLRMDLRQDIVLSIRRWRRCHNLSLGSEMGPDVVGETNDVYLLLCVDGRGPSHKDGENNLNVNIMQLICNF